MSVIDVLLSKIDIIDLIGEYTDLSTDTKGVSRGCCPIHKGDNPTSLCVFDDGWYFCHSCSSYGNAIHFYADLEGLAFYQAIEALAERYNIDLKNDKSYQEQKNIVKTNASLMAKFHKNVSTVEQHLIEKRGLSKEILEEFMIGYSDDKYFLGNPEKPNSLFNGIIFPIHDIYGRVVGFSKRRTDGDTKPTYINSPDNPLFKKGSLLFNLNRARKRFKDTKKIYVCEGYMDSISAHMQGLAACAYIGGYLTKEQLKILKDINKMMPGLTFIFAPDNPNIDAMGAKELPKIRDKILKYAPELNARVPMFPDDCKDFNDCHKKGIEIDNLPTQHIDIAVLMLLLKQCNDKEQEYQIADKYIRTVKSELIKSDISILLAKKWEKSIDDVKKQFSVQVENVDEKLEKFNDIFDCFTALDEAVDDEELSIGNPKMDANITFRKKRVILLGAFSNSGKTENLIEWILHWVIRLRKNVLFFSLEMPKEDILEIVIAKIKGMPQHKVRAYIKTEEGKGVYQQVADVIQKYLYIIDENDLSIKDMEDYIVLANSKVFDKGVDIVCTDYYQYLAGVSTIDDDKKTARSMKKIAKRYNVMFVMLSQFNKQSQRKGKDDIPEPTMVDLNGAGDIGFSADVIILLWRPIYFQKMSDTEYELQKYTSKIKVAKARGGFKHGVTHYELVYDPDTSRLKEK